MAVVEVAEREEVMEGVDWVAAAASEVTWEEVVEAAAPWVVRCRGVESWMRQ